MITVTGLALPLASPLQCEKRKSRSRYRRQLHQRAGGVARSVSPGTVGRRAGDERPTPLDISRRQRVAGGVQGEGREGLSRIPQP